MDRTWLAKAAGSPKSKNLTGYEIDSLPQSYNLTDGHAFRRWFAAEEAVIDIVANYLRMNHLSLSLIEPCFDNLADIFSRHDIPLRPVPDALLEAPGDTFEHALSTIDSDAICLVTPNYPTGKTLAESNLRSLLRFCKERRKLLILDNCFRAYLPRDVVYDEYRRCQKT
jgi:histidinol-phosphate/aromatic aminotransferase/cobyric acid decarboxylase-like protein